MLEKILRWYQAAMIGDVRSPLVHLFGPPGCGKSSSVYQAAEILGCRVHTVNVSRLSPLDLEGVQMPVENNTRLHMLTATWWTRLQDGDIILLDEFLRGFPEVYNGLLDILTSRQVGDFVLPRVFFIAASNTTVAYDKALEDRLLHVPVRDPRSSKSAREDLVQRLVQEAGLHPKIATGADMAEVITNLVLPMYGVLDDMKKRKQASAAAVNGMSIRKIAGQILMRELTESALKELIETNNRLAIKMSQPQYVIVVPGQEVDLAPQVLRAHGMLTNSSLDQVQRRNIEINMALVQQHAALHADVEEVDIFTKEEA